MTPAASSTTLTSSRSAAGGAKCSRGTDRPAPATLPFAASLCMCMYTGAVMATKTISIDLEAYNRLKSVKKPDESFSQTIKRVVRKPVDLDALFRRLAKDPLSKEAVEAVEQQIAQRHGPQNRRR